MEEMLDEIEETELNLEMAEEDGDDEEYIDMLETQLTQLKYERDNMGISSI